MTGKRFLVFGRVQGVGFRWSTRKVARELGITGWCRNLPDRSVEVCAFGDESQVSQLFAWLHQGPQTAVVERVESFLVEEPPTADFRVL